MESLLIRAPFIPNTQWIALKEDKVRSIPLWGLDHSFATED